MADLAPLRAAHEPRLACAERGEVVVVEVPLLFGWRQIIDQQSAAGQPQGCDVQYLRLTALEQPRSVSRREHPHPAEQRAKLIRATPVDADSLSDDSPAHHLFGDRAEGVAHLSGGVRIVTELLGEFHRDRRRQIGLCGLALSLVCDPLRGDDSLQGR